MFDHMRKIEICINYCIRKVLFYIDLRWSNYFYLEMVWHRKLGGWFSYKHPKTFNEKIQYLKLHDHNPQYHDLVDKFEVKNVVSKLIGKEYVIPTLGLWEHVNDIAFDELPRKFVLKCTHDSGSSIIVDKNNTLDIQELKSKLSKSLKKNYYLYSREWAYRHVTPRIIAEPYLNELDTDETNEDLFDYKFMCFNGKVKCSFVCTERQSEDGLKVTFFDREWNRMPFERHYHASAQEIPRPDCYDEMIAIAEKLSEDIPFVRIDLYEIGGKIYFGEYTFYPGGGLEEFSDNKWDRLLGDWLVI